jgi:hypothetical protein
MFGRGNVYYWGDRMTGQRKSLQARDAIEAQRIVQASNDDELGCKSVGPDDDVGCFNDGVGFLAFFEFQTGGGFRGDARNDFDSGSDFQRDGTADGAFLEAGDFSGDDIAGADFHKVI